MKHPLRLTLAASLLACAAQGQTVSSVINYQGRVTDSTGMPVGATGTPSAPVAAPTNRKVRFRIYDASTAGTRKYSEEQTVTISLGEFSVLVGQGTPIGGETNPAGGLPAVFTDLTGSSASRYLGITVDNGDGTFNASDFEITPRQQITSTGFAFRAKTAEGLATGGLSSGSAPVHLVGGGGTVANSRLAILQASGATDSVAIQFRDPTTDRTNFGLAGADGMFSSSALTGDTVLRTANANRLHLQNGTGASGLTLSGNNVGIGTASPGALLHVLGSQGNFQVHPVFAPANSTIFAASLNSGNANGMQFRFSRTGNFIDIGQNGSGDFVVENGLDTAMMTITQGGNVGLGTAPAGFARLHTLGGDIILQAATPSASHSLALFNSAGTERGAFAMAGGTGSFSSDAVLGDAILRSSGKLLLQSGSGASAIAVSPTNNVGIGTASPGSKLEVSNGTTRFQVRPGELNGTANAAAVTLEYVGVGTIGIWDDLRVSTNCLVDGSLGVGTSPGARLHIKAQDNSRNAGIRLEQWNSTNRWNIHNDTNGNALVFSFNDQFSGSSYCYVQPNQAGLITVSDASTKKDITGITGSLAKVMAMRPVSYRYKDAEAKSPLNYGFIAQEVATVYPDVVLTHNKLKTLNSNSIIAINTRAIQELKQEKDAEIKARDEKIAALESKLADMAAKEKDQEARLSKLEQALAGGSAPESSATKKVAATRSTRR